MPGEIGDLSSFDPKELYQHKKLNAYFTKGLLANLGNASPAGSAAALRSARDRISKLGLTDYIAKPAKSGANNNRNKIGNLLKRNTTRPKSGFDYEKERYSDEYHQNMNPSEGRQEYSQPKPRPKIDDDFRSMQVNPDGVISEFGAYGTIETGVLTGETTHLTDSPKSKVADRSQMTVSDSDGNEYNVSLKKIEERIKRKCIGSTSSGKMCKKWAVTDFQSCLTHMSRSEKKAYEELKRKAK